MKKTTNLTMLLIGVAQLLLGIWLVFANIDLASLVFKLLGVAFLVAGLVQIIATIYETKEYEYTDRNVVSGALNGIIGIILITRPELAVGVTTIIIGMWLMINGALQLSASFSLKRLGVKLWPIITVLGAVIIVLGYLLITTTENNFISSVLAIYIGGSLALSGLIAIITAFSSNVAKAKLVVVKKRANDGNIEVSKEEVKIEDNSEE